MGEGDEEMTEGKYRCPKCGNRFYCYNFELFCEKMTEAWALWNLGENYEKLKDPKIIKFMNEKNNINSIKNALEGGDCKIFCQACQTIISFEALKLIGK